MNETNGKGQLAASSVKPTTTCPVSGGSPAQKNQFPSRKARAGKPNHVTACFNRSTLSKYFTQGKQVMTLSNMVSWSVHPKTPSQWYLFLYKTRERMFDANLGQPAGPLVATKAAITATTQHVAHRIVLRSTAWLGNRG